MLNNQKEIVFIIIKVFLTDFTEVSVSCNL